MSEEQKEQEKKTENQGVAHVGGEAEQKTAKKKKDEGNRIRSHRISRQEEQERQKNWEQLQKEIHEKATKPISFERFKKTRQEHEELKRVKKEHKAAILNAGKDPRYHLNP